MLLFKQLVLKDSIVIKSTPEEIWEFFADLEQNYKNWHPKDHILFRWTGGKPMETGSAFYAEQYVMGEIKKYKGTIGESIPNRKIVFELSFPMSLFSPRFEWQIKPQGQSSVFTAKTYVRFGILYKKFFKKGMKAMIEAHNKHTGQEAENLKRILEQKVD